MPTIKRAALKKLCDTIGLPEDRVKLKLHVALALVRSCVLKHTGIAPKEDTERRLVDQNIQPPELYLKALCEAGVLKEHYGAIEGWSVITAASGEA